MPFADLYNAVQNIEGRISTTTLKTLAIEHSDIKAVQEVWSNLIDPDNLRGCYIEGPGKWSCIEIPEHDAVIILSRDMCAEKHYGKYIRRLVYTKELMHVFDTATEKADTEEKYDEQILRFGDTTLEITPQFRAEGKAFYRAFMVLCQEAQRKEYKAGLEKEDSGITPEYVATQLHLPTSYIHHLFREDFEQLTVHLMKG